MEASRVLKKMEKSFDVWKFLFNCFRSHSSEVAISTLVLHFLIEDVRDVRRAALQVPAVLHFVGAGVADEWSAAPVQILHRRRQVWSTERLVGSANGVGHDVLRWAAAVARHLC